MYLRTKGVDKMDEMGPKTSDSCDMRRITLRTMSPKYIPPIIFSNPYKQYQPIDYLILNLENRIKRNKRMGT